MRLIVLETTYEARMDLWRLIYVIKHISRECEITYSLYHSAMSVVIAGLMAMIAMFLMVVMNATVLMAVMI